MLGGPWVLHHWTGGHVPPSRGLLGILLLVVLMYALWSTSSTVHSSINKHQKLAGWYLFGTGLTVIVTYFSAKYYGLMAAAASLLLSETIMNLYVVPQSLRFSHDTFGAFLGSMFTFPAALHPRSLANRFRRKPQLES